MGFNQIGILSIGEMGYHWARTLGAHGAKVLTFAGDRSEATQRRAESVGVELVPSLEDLVSCADLLVSIVETRLQIRLHRVWPVPLLNPGGAIFSTWMPMPSRQ